MSHPRSIGLFAALALVTSVSVAWPHGSSTAPSAKPPTVVSPPPVKATMIGEIIDPQCYFSHASRGPEHAACALMCAKGGQTLAFLDEKSGRTYPLIALGHGKNPNQLVLGVIGRRVSVRGTVYGMGKDVVLAIESAALAK